MFTSQRSSAVPMPMVRLNFYVRSPISLFFASFLLLASMIFIYTLTSSFVRKEAEHVATTRNSTVNLEFVPLNESSSRPNRLTIPKIFHQTYASTKIIDEYKQYISGCLKLNPDWQYYMWRDEDIVAFIRDHFPEFMRKYKHFYMYVQRGDSIRYMVLHHFGGIYVDMDVECQKPFFPRLANYTAFVDQEAREHAAILYSREFTAMNSAMGSVRGHPFFRRMVSAMMEVDDKQRGAGQTTGPDLLTAELVKWWQNSSVSDAHPVAMLEPEIFSPLVDTKLHNFRHLCGNILRGHGKKPGSEAELRAKQIRENACRDFARINWRRDKSTSDTIGRHQFLHLGYLHRSGLPRHFDIVQLKSDVKFYSLHRMKP